MGLAARLLSPYPIFCDKLPSGTILRTSRSCTCHWLFPSPSQSPRKNQFDNRYDRLIDVNHVSTDWLSWNSSCPWLVEYTYVSKYGAVLHQPRVQDTRHVFFTINFIIHRENGGVKNSRQKLLVQFHCTLYNHGVSTSYTTCSLKWPKNCFRKELSEFTTCKNSLKPQKQHTSRTRCLRWSP